MACQLINAFDQNKASGKNKTQGTKKNLTRKNRARIFENTSKLFAPRRRQQNPAISMRAFFVES